MLVLPALLFRAFIPLGFMPVVAESGGLTIGFCPGEAALPPGVAVYALPTGSASRDDLLARRPDRLLHKFSDLLVYLPAL